MGATQIGKLLPNRPPRTPNGRKRVWERWTDLNYVGLRLPSAVGLQAPRASTLNKSAFGLLNWAFGLARPIDLDTYNVRPIEGQPIPGMLQISRS